MSSKSSISLLVRWISYIVGFVGIFIVFFTVTISGGERGVISHFGAIDSKALEPGVHFVVPFRDSVEQLDVRVQNHEVESVASTKDLQELNASFAVNYALIPDVIAETYKQQGSLSQIVDRIIAPQTQESFKTAAAQFTAEESVTQRENLKNTFDNILSQRLAKYGISIFDTNIVKIAFSQEFANAVEAKQVAEQESQRAVYVAARIAEEAKGFVNKAKGETEAQQLVEKSLTGNILKKLDLENQAAAIAKWDGKLPGVSSGVIPFLQIEQTELAKAK